MWKQNQGNCYCHFACYGFKEALIQKIQLIYLYFDKIMLFINQQFLPYSINYTLIQCFTVYYNPCTVDDAYCEKPPFSISPLQNCINPTEMMQATIRVVTASSVLISINGMTHI